MQDDARTHAADRLEEMTEGLGQHFHESFKSHLRLHRSVLEHQTALLEEAKRYLIQEHTPQRAMMGIFASCLKFQREQWEIMLNAQLAIAETYRKVVEDLCDSVDDAASDVVPPSKPGPKGATANYDAAE